MGAASRWLAMTQSGEAAIYNMKTASTLDIETKLRRAAVQGSPSPRGKGKRRRRSSTSSSPGVERPAPAPLDVLAQAQVTRRVVTRRVAVASSLARAKRCRDWEVEHRTPCLPKRETVKGLGSGAPHSVSLEARTGATASAAEVIFQSNIGLTDFPSAIQEAEAFYRDSDLGGYAQKFPQVPGGGGGEDRAATGEARPRLGVRLLSAVKVFAGSRASGKVFPSTEVRLTNSGVRAPSRKWR